MSEISPTPEELKAAIAEGHTENNTTSTESSPTAASESPIPAPATPDKTPEPTEADKKAFQDLLAQISNESGKPVGTTSPAEQSTQAHDPTRQELPSSDISTLQSQLEDAALREDTKPKGGKRRWLKGLSVASAIIGLIWRH